MSSKKFNIYQAYLYKYKKFIFCLSYTPGLDISAIISDIQKTFNLLTIKLDGSNMLKTDSIFDYDKLNNNIEKILEENNNLFKLNLPGEFGKGILLYGLNFPPNKIKTQIDLQLHISSSLSIFLKTNSDENSIPIYTVDDYNNFKELLKDNKINKYYNIKSSIGSEFNDSIFEKIIDFLEFKVYGKDYNLYSTKAKKENEQNKSQQLVNPNAIDILEVSKHNELIRNQIDDDTTELALSIAADNADYSGKYNNPRKETAYYINKKIAENFTDEDMSTEWDSDSTTDIDNTSDTNNINIQSGGMKKIIDYELEKKYFYHI
jgi:hypothetical protein